MKMFNAVRLRRFVLLSAVVLAGTRPHLLYAATDSAETLYRQAYVQETIDRDPAKAIDLYKQVISLTGDQKGLAAKVHLRLGLCYEKLGRLSEAQLSYKDVLDMGSLAPAAIAAQAREHLQRLTETAQPAAAPEADGSSASPIEPLHLSGRWEASLLSGPAVPVGNDTFGVGNPSVGGSVQASLLFQVLPWLSIGPEMGYSAGYKLSASDFFTTVDYSLSLFQFTPEIQAGPWIRVDRFTFKPYAVFGGGLYYANESVEVTDHFSPFAPLSAESSGAHGGLNFGGGLLLKLGDHIAVGPDIRYHYILSSNENFHFLAAQARVAYMF